MKKLFYRLGTVLVLILSSCYQDEDPLFTNHDLLRNPDITSFAADNVTPDLTSDKVKLSASWDIPADYTVKIVGQTSGSTYEVKGRDVSLDMEWDGRSITPQFRSSGEVCNVILSFDDYPTGGDTIQVTPTAITDYKGRTDHYELNDFSGGGSLPTSDRAVSTWADWSSSASFAKVTSYEKSLDASEYAELEYTNTGIVTNANMGGLRNYTSSFASSWGTDPSKVYFNFWVRFEEDDNIQKVRLQVFENDIDPNATNTKTNDENRWIEYAPSKTGEWILLSYKYSELSGYGSNDEATPNDQIDIANVVEARLVAFVPSSDVPGTNGKIHKFRATAPIVTIGAPWSW